MDEQEIAGLEREHVLGDCVGADDEPHCAAFGAHGDGCVEWPCDVARLVAEVRTLERALEDAVYRMASYADFLGRHPPELDDARAVLKRGHPDA